jgi:pheromone shutdown protein TraB
MSLQKILLLLFFFYVILSRFKDPKTSLKKIIINFFLSLFCAKTALIKIVFIKTVQTGFESLWLKRLKPL